MIHSSLKIVPNNGERNEPNKSLINVIFLRLFQPFRKPTGPQFAHDSSTVSTYLFQTFIQVRPPCPATESNMPIQSFLKPYRFMRYILLTIDNLLFNWQTCKDFSAIFYHHFCSSRNGYYFSCRNNNESIVYAGRSEITCEDSIYCSKCSWDISNKRRKKKERCKKKKTWLYSFFPQVVVCAFRFSLDLRWKFKYVNVSLYCMIMSNSWHLG